MSMTIVNYFLMLCKKWTRSSFYAIFPVLQYRFETKHIQKQLRMLHGDAFMLTKKVETDIKLFQVQLLMNPDYLQH